MPSAFLGRGDSFNKFHNPRQTSVSIYVFYLNSFQTFQDEYFGNLTAEADVNRSPPVLTKIARFNGRNRLEDLLNYRDYDYKIIDADTYERKYTPRKEQPCPIEI